MVWFRSCRRIRESPTLGDRGVGVGRLSQRARLAGHHAQPVVVGEPQCNGAIERFIRTLKEQCFWRHRFETLGEVRYNKRLYDAASGMNMYAGTWISAGAGTQGGDAGYILQALSESLDQFILDYLHVNEDAC